MSVADGIRIRRPESLVTELASRLAAVEQKLADMVPKSPADYGAVSDDVRRVADALNTGMSIRGAAKSLGLARSKVERLRLEARAAGLLVATGR